jgi:hypothetical protein
MANVIKVTVARVSPKPGEKNGNYIHTLATKDGEITVLGIKKQVFGKKYFIALPEKAAVGSEHEVDLDMFNQRIIPYVTDEVDPETGENVIIQCTWLMGGKAA